MEHYSVVKIKFCPPRSTWTQLSVDKYQNIDEVSKTFEEMTANNCFTFLSQTAIIKKMYCLPPPHCLQISVVRQKFWVPFFIAK